MKNPFILVFLFLLISAVPQLIGQQNTVPAFPGAEGHGRYTTGGRGGRVYFVTSLNDDVNEYGTLRYALENNAFLTTPYTVLFKVSGIIHLKRELRVRNGNMTIAGQSAPGDGICLRGFPFFVEADNVIIRYMRFRMGDLDDTNADGADAMGGRKYKNIIIDHCSMSWSTDECASFYDNDNFTLQWSVISESLRLSGHSKGAHGYGGIWGGRGASFLHNLMAHHDSRNPRLGPSASTTPDNECVDMRNNVIYNWGSNSCYGGEAMHVNVVNNYYKPGPATPTGSKRGRILSIDKKTDNSMPNIQNIYGTFYVDGNVVDDGKNDKNCINATNDNWTYGVYNQYHSSYGVVSEADKQAMRRSTPVPFGEVVTHSAKVAYEKVLAFAGCSYKRDSQDARVINEVATGTAPFKGLSAANSGIYPLTGILDSQQDLKPAGAAVDWSAWPLLNATAPAVDTDADGMPDAWELGHGLSPVNSIDGLLMSLHPGYTNLEVYLNSLVENITTEQSKVAITSLEDTKYEELNVRVGANPICDNLLSLSSDREMEQVLLFSIGGTKVLSEQVNSSKVSVNLSSIPSGFYVGRILFKDDDSSGVIKFFKY